MTEGYIAQWLASSAISIRSHEESDDSNDIGGWDDIWDETAAIKGLKNVHKKLCFCLDNLKSSGAFAAQKTYAAFVNPGLDIAGHGPIPLPLTVNDAESIKSVCERAPFGQGDKTVVNTSVRNTWELNHSQFKTANPEWNSYLTQVLADATVSLGLQNVHVVPHKLLLYEKGSFFKRHKDSEKTRGMVGTLVICLPSMHQGGDVCLSFGGQDRVFATSTKSAFNLTALSWYSDVTHEVRELISGYRLVLTYNIIQTNQLAQSAIAHRVQSERLQSLVSSWQGFESRPSSIIYRLDHKYTEASLSLKNMKGRDRAVCDALCSIGPATGIILLLCNITYETGEGGSEGWWGSYEEPTLTLDKVFTCDGIQIGATIDVEMDQVLGNKDYLESDPDSEIEGEFTGNEAMPSRFRYHNTVSSDFTPHFSLWMRS
jgi:hypothetical protein